MNGVLSAWREALPPLLDGLTVSLGVAAVIFAIGLPLGVILGVLGTSTRRQVRGCVVAVVEVGRGIPALVVLQMVYFGLPSAGLVLDSFAATVAALAFNLAAYSSEVVRGGLQSVPRGEVEACVALGLSPADSLRYVVLPQGLRIAIPALIGNTILMFQATSLAFTISLPELMNKSYSAASASFEYLNVFLLAGLLYAAICLIGIRLAGMAEERLSRHT